MAAPQQLVYTLASIEMVPREVAQSGACHTANVPADVFFGETKQEIAQAKAVCGSCIAQAKCLSYAINNEDYGVWGGTTPAERRKLRTQPFVSPEARRDSEALRAALLRHDRIADIARRFGVVERTIYRWKAKWLEDLQAAGDLATIRQLQIEPIAPEAA